MLRCSAAPQHTNLKSNVALGFTTFALHALFVRLANSPTTKVSTPTIKRTTQVVLFLLRCSAAPQHTNLKSNVALGFITFALHALFVRLAKLANDQSVNAYH